MVRVSKGEADMNGEHVETIEIWRRAQEINGGELVAVIPLDKDEEVQVILRD